MPPLFAGSWVFPPVLLGEDPLPAPFSGSVGVLAVQGIGHQYPAPSINQIPLVDLLDFLQMILKRFLERFREHRHPVLGALTVPNHDFAAGKIEVLNPKAKAF